MIKGIKENEWKKGWKVINKLNRMSCTILMRHHPVLYKKNEITTPESGCGPLAVFRTRELAIDFVYLYNY